MKSLCRVFVIIAASLMLAHPLTITAQRANKPYTEWSEKEATKLLNDSPWAQTHSFTDTARSASTQATGVGATTAIAEVINVHFRVRFLSAKPTRQAIARFVELQQKGKLSEQMTTQLKAFAAADFPDYIVVTVVAESDKPSNMLQQANAALYKLTTSELKNNTYLVLRDGKRLFLQEYQPPRSDGFGARFIFPRLVNGTPFVTESGGEILFHSDLSGGSVLNSTIPNSSIPNRAGGVPPRFGFTISTRYKVKDMMFDGKLEY
ncbi:MAG: hypothetical protein AABN33_23390 [Acidobacteriota bacterium]